MRSSWNRIPLQPESVAKLCNRLALSLALSLTLSLTLSGSASCHGTATPTARFLSSSLSPSPTQVWPAPASCSRPPIGLMLAKHCPPIHPCPAARLPPLCPNPCTCARARRRCAHVLMAAVSRAESIRGPGHREPPHQAGLRHPGLKLNIPPYFAK